MVEREKMKLILTRIPGIENSRWSLLQCDGMSVLVLQCNVKQPACMGPHPLLSHLFSSLVNVTLTIPKFHHCSVDIARI